MRRLICSLSLLVAVFSAASADEPKVPEPVGYARDAGPLSVEGEGSVTIRDDKRKSNLVVRVHYPKGDGSFPVIVFSHGFGTGKDAFAAVGKHWASHGYVTIHPNHSDGGRLLQMKGVNETDPEQRREELRKRIAEQRKSGEKRGLGGIGGSTGLSDRVHDVSAVIDALGQLEDKVPALKGKLDKERIGVSGHSFGAATVMLVGGITAALDGKKGQSFLDPRVKCVLPFSGSGTGEYGLTPESFKSSKLPTLYVTGTKDVRPGKEFEWRREAYEGSPAGDKFLVVMDGATHFHFGGGHPAGSRLAGLGGGRGGDKYTPLVKDVSVAFFDAYLKGSQQAKAYLMDRFAKQSGTVATLESK